MSAARAQKLVNGWETVRFELLNTPIRDLGLQIEGSPVEPLIQRLYSELESKGIKFRPEFYATDGWGCPDEVPIIGIPFYLLDKRLIRIEEEQTGEIENSQMIMMLLRHEAGHALNYAYRLYKKPDWLEVFGQFSKPYRDNFRPNPFSRQFVRHIVHHQYGRTYAQKHPDEDFAETFAVWLATPPEEWRERYRGWKALEKLEYVHALMQEVAVSPPAVKRRHRISEARKLRKTLGRYYAARRKLYAEDFPDFYDADLRAIFRDGEPGGETAARLMRKNREALVASIVQWTGQPKYTVSMLVRKLILRCQELKLPAPFDHARLHFELAAYLASLVTNHLHTGRFKRSV